MKLSLVGLNHRTAPVELRERLAFSTAELPAILQQLLSRVNAREAMVLSTCNRVEITTRVEDAANMEAAMCEFLAYSHAVSPDLIRPHLYSYEDADAIRHLFRVASSLDSMIVGEPQILGQLKQAFSIAREQGAVGPVLEAVLARAFNVAKRIRSETEIGQNAVSIGYAAVELAKEIFGSLERKRIMIIGAGKMSELAARHLQRSGATEILITNRTLARAEQMASLFRGEVIPYQDCLSAIHRVDIVIASSGSPNYVLKSEDVRRALEARRNQPIFLIDIAVPRNIDPDVNQLEHAFLYDIDDLQRIVERNLKGRKEVAEQAEEIVAVEVERLQAKLRTRDVVPTIVSLQEQLENIRQGEVARFRGKMGLLTAEQEQVLEALTRGIVNKIAHGPISELRREAAGPLTEEQQQASEMINVVRRVFRLHDR